MHFQIFIPKQINDGSSPAAMLAKIGLADLADGAFSTTGSAEDSPTDSGGIVIGWVPSHVGFRKNREGQTWVPSIATNEHEAGTYWVGFWDDSPPRPEELQRPDKQLHRGDLTTMADGNQWLIPSFKRLPRDLVPDSDGKLVSETKPRFKSLEELGTFWSHRLDEGDIPFSEIAEVTIHIMRLNYRLTQEVAFHLRILDTETIVRPLLIFTGWSAERAEAVSLEISDVE